MSRASPLSLNGLLPKSTVPKFYQNRAVELFAAKPSTPISLKHLINFGKYGRNKGEKEEGEKLLKGGNFLRTELPTRLSHRLRDMQSLPFIVASHPRLVRVYDMYLDAFERIRKFPPLESLEDNDRFCAFMQSTLDHHQVVIPELAIAVAETSPVHLPPTALDNFMHRMLRSRISRRVITEQHIALTTQFRERQRDRGKSSSEERRVGVVDTRLNAAEVASKCSQLIRGRGGPEGTVPVILDGELGTSFAYIPEHLEFMLFELIKNAAFGTVERHGVEEAQKHPIRVTIVHGPQDLTVRVSDEAGGIPPWSGLPPTPNPLTSDYVDPSSPVLPALTSQRLDIFSFSHMRRLHLHHTSQDSDALTGTDGLPNSGIMALRGVSKLAGTVEEQLYKSTTPDGAGSTEIREATDLMDAQMKSGIGLPLAKMFAEYFSGSLQFHTVRGFGSDARLVIPKFGSAS